MFGLESLVNIQVRETMLLTSDWNDRMQNWILKVNFGNGSNKIILLKKWFYVTEDFSTYIEVFQPIELEDDFKFDSKSFCPMKNVLSLTFFILSTNLHLDKVKM